MLNARSALAWWNEDWALRERVTLNAAGLNLSGERALQDVPVLVRLHTANFPFFDAREDGADLRFVAADDKTLLKFHVESYDSANELALVWVRVPHVDLQSPQAIWLYFGNPKAQSASDSAGTFDSATALVLHFAEHDGPPLDATAAKHPVTASASARPLLDGFIDGARRLTSDAKIEVTGVQSGPSGMTVTGWLRVPKVVERGLVFAWPVGGGGLTVEFEGSRLTARVGGVRVPAKADVAAGSWHAFAVTLGERLTLYVDGIAQGDAAVAPVALAGPAAIGGLEGDIDEVTVSSVPRSAAWLQTTFAAQAENGNLVTVSEAEQRRVTGRSYLTILLSAVTADGWVVIGILLAMFVLSVIVMVGKMTTLAAAATANRHFLLDFQARPEQMLDPAQAQTVAGTYGRAPLSRLWLIALRELKNRLDRYERRGRPQQLTQPALSAIKASLDAGLVYESERLNDHMVLLTIAISGGPFLGLLGTVTGVMITFAAIAAVGEVNVNSIAPGIAAALVATVAGLVVAIPALFGYNYLANRVRRMTGEMAVFADELLTRLAETYSD